MDKLIILASKNEGKIREFKQLLSGLPVALVNQPNDLEVEETGKTFMENARIKAFQVANCTGAWSLADDSGLSVEALSGRPGIYSARYAKTDAERIDKLLFEMRDFSSRQAYFSCALCLAAPKSNVLVEVEGRCEGSIAYAPRGAKGFGYDPIFEPKTNGLTFAEMGINEKKSISHRAHAFNLLKPKLEKLLENYKCSPKDF